MVKETGLYDLLGVAPDATEAQIKKGYYIRARQCHPDKNPGDPEAKEKFQAVGTAYQILSDKDKRAAYDRFGEAGVSDTPVMDAGALFSVLFGSDVFEDYVGTLQLAMAATIVSEGGQQPSREELQAKMAAAQKEREAKLAGLLRQRLSLYASLGKDGFEQRMREEANQLSKATFGPEMLQTIGYMYSRGGAKELGKTFKTLGVGWAWEALRGVGHSTKTTFSAVSGIVGLQVAQQDMQRQMQAGQLSQQQAEALMAAKAEEILANLWKVNVKDIETTLGNVITAVLEEPGATVAQREERARALKKAGKVFQTVAMRAKELRGPLAGLSKTFGGRPAPSGHAQAQQAQQAQQGGPGYPPPPPAGAYAAGGAAAGYAAAGARPGAPPGAAGYHAPPPGAQPHYAAPQPPPPSGPYTATPAAAPPPPGQQGQPGPKKGIFSQMADGLAELGDDFKAAVGLDDRPAPQPYYAAPAYAAPGGPGAPPPPYYYQPAPGGPYYAYPAAPGGAPPAQGVPVQGMPVPPPQAAPGRPPAAAAAPPQQPDFENMSVHDLKQYVASRGATLQGAIEKQDLVAICRALSS